MPTPIITLEDKPTIAGTSRLPHFTALEHDLVAADICNGNWPALGTEWRGIAMGMKAQPELSNVGMFADKNLNTYIVTTQQARNYAIMNESVLWGPSATVFTRRRAFGGGSAEINMRFLQERNRDEAARIIGRETSVSGWITQHGITYSGFQDLAAQIEGSGRRFPGAVVFILEGEPITLASIARTVLAVALSTVSFLGSTFGIPKDLLDALTPILEALVDGKPLNLAMIAKASQMIAPPSIRAYIDDGEKVLTNVAAGNYYEAARVLGIDSVRAVQDLYRSSSAVIGTGSIAMNTVAKIVQNTFNIDTINKLRNQLRSGTVIDRIIDEGSITRMPALQNMFTAVMAGGYVSTLPNITKMVSTTINDTYYDITPVNHRALIRMATGERMNTGDVMDLTIRSLTEQAINQARTGAKFFFLPVSIPGHLRSDMAREIAKQSGTSVIGRIPGGGEWY